MPLRWPQRATGRVGERERSVRPAGPLAVWLRFPSLASIAVREIRLIKSPLEQALMFLVSSAVLGILVAYLLGQFGVQPEQAQQIAAIVVAVATAALAAGLKFVPPDVLGLTVWQTLVAVFGFFSSLGLKQVLGSWRPLTLAWSLQI